MIIRSASDAAKSFKKLLIHVNGKNVTYAPLKDKKHLTIQSPIAVHNLISENLDFVLIYVL